jgi:hypothetical protein
MVTIQSHQNVDFDGFVYSIDVWTKLTNPQSKPPNQP